MLRSYVRHLTTHGSASPIFIQWETAEFFEYGLAWRNNIRRIVALRESSLKSDLAAFHGLQSAMYPSAKVMDIGTSQRTVKRDISVNRTDRIDRSTELLLKPKRRFSAIYRV